MDRALKFLAPIHQENKRSSFSIEPLLQRIAESALLEDRRHALNSLKDQLVDHRAKQAFGACDGFQVLLTAAQEDRDDIDSVRSALEALGLAAYDPTNAAQLVRTPNALPYLLSLLEPPPVGSSDFYIRYHAVSALQSLLSAGHAPALREAILTAPLGIVRLLDLMTAEQEALRNEGLVLLRGLVAGAPEVQKIAAFEGALDKAFKIATEEQGGVVVQDALLLAADILKASASNQLILRETGLASQLLPLLDTLVKAGHSNNATTTTTGTIAINNGDNDAIDADIATSVAALLEVIRILLIPCPDDYNSHKQNAAVLLGHGLMGTLLHMGFEEEKGTGIIKCAALHCLAALVSHCAEQRDAVTFLTVKLPSGELLQLPHAALRVATTATASAYIAYGGGSGGGSAAKSTPHNTLQQQLKEEEATAADAVLEACCRGNTGLQAALAATFSAGSQSFGGELVMALTSRGNLQALAVASKAACALGHVVGDNTAVKAQVLGAKCPPPFNLIMTAAAQGLATTVTTQGGLSAAAKPAIDFFRLLVEWTYGCPAATSAFLSSVQKTPFLVGAIKASNVFGGDTAARGLAALLLGISALQAEPAQAKILLDVAIVQQLSLEGFLVAIDGLLQSSLLRDGNVRLMSRGTSLRLAELNTLVRREVSLKIAGTNGPDSPIIGQHFIPPSAAANMTTTVPQHHQYLPSDPPPPPPPLSSVGAYSFAPTTSSSPPPPAPTTSNGNGQIAGVKTTAEVPPSPTHTRSINTYGSEKLKEAQHRIQILENEIEQLKSRNANLAEDVLRLSSSSGSNSGASGGGNGGGHASSSGELMTSLDKEKLKTAENRVASAEKEASTLRNELLAAADRESEAQRAAQRAGTDADAAKAAAARIETELQDLSAAYATLDSHTNSLQQRLDEIELQKGGGGGEGKLLDGYLTKEEAEAATIKAADEAREEADASMEDLLVCLGEEEAKVAVLAAKLEELGVSSDVVLSALV